MIPKHIQSGDQVLLTVSATYLGRKTDSRAHVFELFAWADVYVVDGKPRIAVLENIDEVTVKSAPKPLPENPAYETAVLAQGPGRKAEVLVWGPDGWADNCGGFTRGEDYVLLRVLYDSEENS